MEPTNKSQSNSGKLDKLTPRSVDQAKWYQEVVLKAEMADYSPVRGCMVFRPYGYRIWELIQADLDARIKKMGVDNAYFPLFIPYSFLEKEASHVEGFAPEVAIVTIGGGKELEEKLVVRPTSETIIYSMFAKWVKSYRDLPMKLNQWCNIIRWEKRTLPFLRTMEFLWQEGHTIHATKEDAEKMVFDALDAYKAFEMECLAVYPLTGKKTNTEKFPGAEYTTTCEILMRDGKALQTGTSHLLSQDFAKSFDIKYIDKDGKEAYPWMTSWGMTTRTIGAVIMAHGDDKGLVLPPNVAPVQVIVVPIVKGDSKDKLEEYVGNRVKGVLESAGIRVQVDWSESSPGWKFAQWELKGVPLRLEIGPREMESGQLAYAKRNDGSKGMVEVENIVDKVKELLDITQKEMFESHKKFVEESISDVSSYEDFKKVIKEKKGFVRVNYVDKKESADTIKYETKATPRCVEFDSAGGECFYSGEKQGKKTIFARAY